MPLQKSIGTKNFTRSNRQISSLEYVNIMMKYNQYISDICSQIWEKFAYVHHKIFLSLKNFELFSSEIFNHKKYIMSEILSLVRK